MSLKFVLHLVGLIIARLVASASLQVGIYVMLIGIVWFLWVQHTTAEIFVEITGNLGGVLTRNQIRLEENQHRIEEKLDDLLSRDS